MEAFRVDVRIFWVICGPIERAGAEASTLNFMLPDIFVKRFEIIIKD